LVRRKDLARRSPPLRVEVIALTYC
jgi:hypothetical protein